MNERDKELAVQAGWIEEAGEPDAGCLNLQQLIDLIRADERETILKLADSLGWVDVDNIKARGNK